jgi:hypothetical protein
VRILPLCLLAAACAACNRSEAATASASRDACGGAQATLALTPRSTFTLPDGAVPAGLALLSDGTLVVAERGSAGVSLYARGGGAPRWIPAPEPIAVLARARGELLAAGLSTVYRVDPASGQAQALMEVPVRAGRIVSLAADERTVWVGTGGLATGNGAVYAAPRARPGAWRQRPMDAPVRLEAAGGGRVAAALTRTPHRVVLLDSALAATGFTQPPAPRRARRGEDARFTQALITLDCGRLLHVISDLRSDRRELNIYQTTPAPRLVRARTLQQPLGFVHAADGHSLVAVTEAGGRRDVVLFNWSWQANQEGT